MNLESFNVEITEIVSNQEAHNDLCNSNIETRCIGRRYTCAEIYGGCVIHMRDRAFVRAINVNYCMQCV